MSATIGSTLDYLNDYDFDDLNRLTLITQTDQSGGNTVTDKRIEFDYNALGQFSEIRRYEALTAGGVELQTQFGYDSQNRLERIEHREKHSGNYTRLHQYEFDYDLMSRITEINSTTSGGTSLDGLSTFQFDLNSQLTVANHASPRNDENYALDANGNRDDDDYDVGSKNQTTADANYTYVYDKEGNRTERIASDGSKLLYEFDHRNRLTRIEFRTSGGALTKSIDYVYDPFNRLVRRTFDANGEASGGVTDQFFAGFASATGTGADELAQPTLEFDGGTATDLTHRYLWGPAVDQLIADEDVTADVLWALADQVGTIRDIARIENSQFVNANHRVYDSFGNLTSQTNGSVTIAFGFTGKWTDAETGMTHHLFRWYDPKIGKWITEDPLSFEAGDANLTRYVSNAPLTHVDSLGLDGELSINGNADHGGPTQLLLPGDPENQSNDDDRLNESDIETSLEKSGIPSIRYIEDPDKPGSGYQCEDYALDAYYFFQRTYSDDPSIRIGIVTITWSLTADRDTRPDFGHTIIEIRQIADGKTVSFLVDPHSGVVRERTGKGDGRAILKDGGVANFGFLQDRDVTVHPPRRPPQDESATDPTVRKTVEDQLKAGGYPCPRCGKPFGIGEGECSGLTPPKPPNKDK
jgi:RHS repeat-associated protein